jgi:hypothetical protein
MLKFVICRSVLTFSCHIPAFRRFLSALSVCSGFFPFYVIWFSFLKLTHLARSAADTLSYTFVQFVGLGGVDIY